MAKQNGINQGLFNVLKTYQFNGDTKISFTFSKGHIARWMFGITSEFLYYDKDKDENICKKLYTMIITYKNGLYIKNETVLMLCARAGMNIVIEQLIKQGCDIHYQNEAGKTAFDLYSPNSASPNEENEHIRSLLNGTYKDDFYVSLYEKQKLDEALNDPQIEKKEILKHKL